MDYGKVEKNSPGFLIRSIINNNRKSIGIKNFSVIGNGVINDSNNLLKSLNYSAETGYAISITPEVNISLGGESLAIPQGASIRFDGGIISNGTLVGNNTTIQAPLLKIFNLDLTLDGTFNMEYICPQHYGAIPNTSRTVYTNECSAEIQKCFDSPLNVFFPNGFYYIDSTIEISKSKSVVMNNYNTLPDNTEKVASYVLEMNHGRIYTDQDINILTIKSQGVSLSGCFDTTQVSDFSSQVITYDCNYKMWGGNIDVYIYGNVNSVVGLGKGGTAIRFDQDNASTLDGNAVFIKIRGYIQWYNIGIKIDIDNPIYSTYVNSLDVDINMMGCKKFINAVGGSMSRYSGILQTRPILVSGEEQTYCVTVESGLNFVNFWLWDMDQSFNTNFGGVSHRRGFLLTGRTIEMGHWTNYFYSISKVQGISQVTSPAIVNSKDSIISKNMLSSEAFSISKLDSETISIDKRHIVTLKKFNGTGKNFETDLDETVSVETSFITIGTPNGIWRVTGSPTSVTFNTGCDPENDYVEIVLTPSSGVFEWAKFYFYFQYFNSRFKRIQLIQHLADTTKTSQIQDGIGNRGIKNTYIFELNIADSVKTIIRFIGSTQVNQIMQIMDIAAIRRTPQVAPYIHIDGGQRVFGTLEANGLYNTSSAHTAPLRLGNYRIWVDTTGALRIKNGNPSSDTDGNLV